MGLLSFLTRKKNKSNHKEDSNVNAKETDSGINKKQENLNIDEKQKDSFVFGVDGTYKLINSDDLVITGKVDGKVSVGDEVCCLNPGDDEQEVFISTVLGIEINRKPAQSASDFKIAIKLENGRKLNIKVGTVLYSKGKTISELHLNYIKALADGYVAFEDLALTDEELEACSLSELAETWKLFIWYHSEYKKDKAVLSTPESKNKLDRIRKAICKKLLSAKEIYCVYNKATGEPNMFSRTVQQNNGYMCEPPDILIITKAYKEKMAEDQEDNGLELKKIENGENGDGIYKFLEMAFYLNGACGVSLMYEQAKINAAMLVKKPDYSNVKDSDDIPVTNPDVERWLLLIGQLGNNGSEGEKIIYNLYYNLMAKEIVKARFLVPVKPDPATSETDENGKVVIKSDTKVGLPIRDGKNGRKAICMYTDLKRLKMDCYEGWYLMTEPMSKMIEMFDCEINPTKFVKAACYIEQDTYKQMKEISENVDISFKK